MRSLFAFLAGSGVAVAAAMIEACVSTAASSANQASSGNSDAGTVSVAVSPDALAGPEPCVDPPESGAEGGLAGDAGSVASYSWQNVKILGGGFVTGVVFSTTQADLIFARTDVGGAYRWDAMGQTWTPMTDWVGSSNANLMGIESIAADPVQANIVYMAAGEYLSAGNGSILSSTDTGNTWMQHAIGAPMGGNANGRSVGERLSIDPNLPSTIFFGSRTTGLWASSDSAVTWSPVAGLTAKGDSNLQTGITFVLFDKRSATGATATPTIYAGVATTSGASLYRTTDGGSSWAPVPNQPMSGLFPHHAAMDAAGDIYFAYNNGPGPNNITAGAVFRLSTSSDTWKDVTPSSATPAAPHGGYGGVTVDAKRAGVVVVTSIDRWPDVIYRTTDGGSNWTLIGPQGQPMPDVAGAQWLYWHGGTPSDTGWMGDIEIDPLHSNRALYVTGQGLWWTEDVASSDTGGAPLWTFQDNGLEQTVPLGLISPPGGAHLLSAVGDICGFRHDDLNKSPPTGMFGNPIFGNTTSLDFAEGHPSLVVRVGTTSSSTQTPSTGAYSTDGGSTWNAFQALPGAGSSAGTIAVSADGTTFVWAPQAMGGGDAGASSMPSFSRNWAQSWTPCSGLPNGARVASDRVNPSKFYARAGSILYVSIDGGATFMPSASADGGLALPRGGVARPVFGHEGELWLTGGGLFHSTDSGATLTTVSAVANANAIGFGRGASCGAYPTLYVSGSVIAQGASTAIPGVYRSDDQGASWQRVDDPQHQFGSVSYVSGDPRIYGRVYLGTGGRGILYGDPQ